MRRVIDICEGDRCRFLALAHWEKYFHLAASMRSKCTAIGCPNWDRIEFLVVNKLISIWCEVRAGAAINNDALGCYASLEGFFVEIGGAYECDIIIINQKSVVLFCIWLLVLRDICR